MTGQVTHFHVADTRSQQHKTEVLNTAGFCNRP